MKLVLGLGILTDSIIDMNIWIGNQSALTRLAPRAVSVDSSIIKPEQPYWAPACYFKVLVN